MPLIIRSLLFFDIYFWLFLIRTSILSPHLVLLHSILDPWLDLLKVFWSRATSASLSSALLFLMLMMIAKMKVGVRMHLPLRTMRRRYLRGSARVRSWSWTRLIISSRFILIENDWPLPQGFGLLFALWRRVLDHSKLALSRLRLGPLCNVLRTLILLISVIILLDWHVMVSHLSHKLIIVIQILIMWVVVVVCCCCILNNSVLTVIVTTTMLIFSKHLLQSCCFLLSFHQPTVKRALLAYVFSPSLGNSLLNNTIVAWDGPLGGRLLENAVILKVLVVISPPLRVNQGVQRFRSFVVSNVCEKLLLVENAIRRSWPVSLEVRYHWGSPVFWRLLMILD